MLSKHSKPGFKKFLVKGATVLLIVEAASFVGSYFIWNRLNTDRNFRFKVRENYPWVLETYYRIGETLGDSKIRQIDLDYWQKERLSSETN